MEKIYFGSLFAGIGGIDLGLERAGMECRWQVENDLFCNRVLERHWPDVRRYGDVKKTDPERVQEECGRVQVVAGGFPCQDLSYAGKGRGIYAERSGLWFEFERFVWALRPRVVLVENVPGLLSRGIDVVLGCLAALGYDAEWDCIPAAVFGAPHLRHRVFIVAYPGVGRGTGKEGIEADGCCGHITRKGSKILQEGPMADTGGFGFQEGMQENDQGQSGMGKNRQSADKRGCDGRGSEKKASHIEGVGQQSRDGSQGVDCVHRRDKGKLVLGDDGPGSGGVWPVEAQPRVVRVADGLSEGLDEAEKKRLQIHQKRQGRMVEDRVRSLGNAVVPQVAEWLGRRMLWAMERGFV